MANWNNEEQEYEGHYIHSTDDAILFLPEDWDEDDAVWLPKSRINHYESLKDLDRGDEIIMIVPNWLAQTNGMI